MPRITAIEPQARRPSRRSVFVDGEFFAGVEAETAVTLRLTVGQEVRPADLRALLEREDEVAAREWCLRWLTVAPRTRRQLAERLERRGVDAATAERVLDRLQASGLVDDAVFARDWIKSRARTGAVGRRRLAAELAQRGVPRDLAAAALDQEAAPDEAAACRDLAEQKAPAYRRLPREAARRRLAGFLSRRGFAPDHVLAAVKAALPDEDRS
jgi:regulatory protein